MGTHRGSAVSASTRTDGRRWTALIASVAVLAASLVAVGAPTSADAASPCGPTVNAIVCENQQPGTDPDVWDIDGAGDPSIQGFATDISVNAGSRIDFKVDTDARDYDIDIYRTGWYQGLGARKITSVPVTAALPQHQPECVADEATDLYDCGTWAVSASWDVPTTAVSGVYLAVLERTDTGGQSHIIFIVRNDGSTSDVLFQTSDPTWHAYNTYGGASFYQGGSHGRAFSLSYNRPFNTRAWENGRDFYFSSEYATVRFLERNGYDVSYIAGVDTDRRGGELLNHDVFLSVGHDEYWSGPQRANIEAARDAGVNLQFLSGNEAYWRTRYEPSVDPSHTPYRTLTSYKETWSGEKIDPSSEWTGTWRDPRFATAAQGAHLPENALTGTMYMANYDDLPVTVSAAEGKTRLWRNTSLTSQSAGSATALAPHTVGYESNEDIDNGFRPAGLIRLSTTIGSTPERLTDYGNVVVEGTTEHHVTLYRAASGALVFSAGSIQWGWGLDQEHDGDGAPADSRMQQAQVNLLADMGAQPGSLMSGLTRAAASTDTTAPTTVITSPAAGAVLGHGATVTISGTASDSGGGVVAGVEVSVDDGATWHPATGTTSWSYTYVQQGHDTVTLRARAIDDSANFSSAGVTRQVTVNGPYSAFGTAEPSIASADDAEPAELGLRFSTEVDGFIAGVRFFKGAANLGTHTGSLWDAAGNRLGTVTFSGESATGWQTAEFLTPIEVIAGQTYVVSYTAPQGGYAMEPRYWPYAAPTSSPIVMSPAVGDAASGVYGPAGTFPTKTWTESNYFVDVLFTTADTSPLRIAARTPSSGAASVDPATPVSVTFTRPADPASVSLAVADSAGRAVAGTTTYDATARTARFVMSGPLDSSTTYTVTPTASDLAGVALEEGAAWSFTTRAPERPEGVCPCSLFSESVVPQIPSAADGDAVTLGVLVTPAQSGTISAVKFYKGAANSGAHVGALWSSAGEQLATVDFTDESAQGWQVAYFTNPVPVTAGQTYIASYTAPNGGYSVSAGAFASSYSYGPLTVPASGSRYTYTGGAPSVVSTTDYAIDVVFEPAADVPSVVGFTPGSGQVDVAVSTAIAATFAAPVADATGSVSADGTDIPGAWSASGDGSTVTFAPAAQLPAGAHITVTLSARAATGTEHKTFSWAFSTLPADAPVRMLGSATPALVDSDTSSVELGLTFRTSVAGTVTAIRYYKDGAATGTHVGSIWGPTGQRIAQVVFADGTGAGWQRAVLSEPVALEPGVDYTVSYFAANGRYVYTPQYFSAPLTSGPLTASATNGRYVYGSGDRMPTETWNAANYFVDVEFVVDSGTPLSVTSMSPAANATEVGASEPATAVIEGDLGGRTVRLALSGPGGAVAGASAFDVATRTLSFTPTDPLSPGVVYTARVYVGNVALESWSFTTGTQIQTLFGSGIPASAAANESDPVEVGTAFNVARAGVVTALRYYRGPANAGVQRGTLWSGDGRVLAQVSFAPATAQGWQRAELSTPVSVQPGTDYVVSYFAPNGGYSYTSGYFAQPVTSGSISAPSVANGRHLYAPAGGFPVSSWGASGYFVDAEVNFDPDAVTAPPSPEPTPSPEPSPSPEPAPAVSVSSVSPTRDAGEVAPTTVVTASFGGDVASPTLSVADGAGPVAGQSRYDADTRTVSFTPDEPLAWSTTYTAEVVAEGIDIAARSWEFTTVAEPDVVSFESLFGTAQPQNEAWNDPDSVQVATRFSVSTAGAVTAIRFYKGSVNTGVHTGYLWRSTDGARLAEVIFVGESAEGWQEMQLVEPIALEPGIEYRVGLHSTTGRYAVDLAGLAAATTSGALSTPAGGSAYTYSTGYPDTPSTHNYWVDVRFSANE